MDVRFLRTLIAVVETGSIAAAARREKLTPAAVSQRIQALERILDCTLLARAARSIGPTETCLSLLPRARHLIKEAEQLKDDALGGGPVGELRVGAISTALIGLLPAAIREMALRAPRLRLRLVPGSSLQLFEQLVAGELDAAILVEPPFALPKSFVGHHIRREPIVYITRSNVSPAEIGAHVASGPFIRYDPSTWGGRLVAQYMEKADLSPDVLCDLDALETIAILVAQGLGNAFVPAWNGLEQDGLRVVLAPGAAAYVRNIHLVHASVASRPQALELLHSALQGDGGRSKPRSSRNV